MTPQKFCCVTEVGKFYVDTYDGVAARFRNLDAPRISRNIRDPIPLKAYIKEYLRKLGSGRFIEMYEVGKYPNPMVNVDFKQKLVDIAKMKELDAIWARRRRGQYEVVSMWAHVPHSVCIFIDILHKDVYFNPAENHQPKIDLDEIAKGYDGIFSWWAIHGEWDNPIPVIGVTFDEKEVPCDLILAKDFRSFELSTKRRFKYFQAETWVRDYSCSDTSPVS